MCDICPANAGLNGILHEHAFIHPRHMLEAMERGNSDWRHIIEILAGKIWHLPRLIFRRFD